MNINNYRAFWLWGVRTLVIRRQAHQTYWLSLTELFSRFEPSYAEIHVSRGTVQPRADLLVTRILCVVSHGRGVFVPFVAVATKSSTKRGTQLFSRRGWSSGGQEINTLIARSTSSVRSGHKRIFTTNPTQAPLYRYYGNAPRREEFGVPITKAVNSIWKFI